MFVQKGATGIAVVISLVGTPIYAQNAPDTPPPAAVDRFLAVDFTGGYLVFPSESSSTPEAPDGKAGTGWHIGATIRPQTWWGATGEIARTTQGDADRAITQYLGGVRLNSPFVTDLGARVFAHALVGVANVHDLSGSRSGAQFVTGAGFDFYFFLRFQVDYALSNVEGLPKHNSRAFIGAVVPLCFKACPEHWGHGIDVAHPTR